MNDELRITNDESGGVAEVINRRGSYQQASAQSAKKAEGKKRRSPCTPFREKGKGKETRRDSLGESQVRAGARARRLPCTCTYAEAREAAAEIVDNCFGSFAKDFRLWSWYCRHFDRRRIVEQAYSYASCQRCGEVRDAVKAFQAWLGDEFGEMGVEGTPMACKKASTNVSARLRTESRKARRSVSGASLPCFGVDETRGGAA